MGGVIRPGAAGRVAQMVGKLAAQGPFDNRRLEAPDGRVQLLVGNRALAHELVENLGRNGRVRLAFRLAAPSYSSCYAPHTNS